MFVDLPVERLLLAGDMHGNTGAALAVIDHAAALHVDLILQLGDFGFWRQGQKFLRKVEARLAARGLELWWVDGNHEDFDRLNVLPVGPDGRRRISDHVWHLPRGFRWRWGDTVWVAAGGAVSVDRNYRTEGVDWFPQEELTGAEVDRIIADGPADMVVAHDAPLGVPFLRRLLHQELPAWRRESAWPTGVLMRSDEHQRRVRRLVEGVQAKRVFHGHHHIAYRDVLDAGHGQVEVFGLGMDADPLSARTLLVDGDGWPIVEVDE
ncbi:MAG: metallophosphoesterase family protein [Propionicimonas sp.]|uniref:metallophosphoesterase family protein n=1 Tax=Propionicimonas sp. TaxID=1955623 RepID=UPI003D098ECC